MKRTTVIAIMVAALCGTFATTSFVATPASADTSFGTLAPCSLNYGRNQAQIEGGFFHYWRDSDNNYYVTLSLIVDHHCQDGYKILLVIKQKNNLFGNWVCEYGSVNPYWFSTSASDDGRELHDVFWTQNSIDYVEATGVRSYRKGLYGGPATNHFEIWLEIWNEDLTFRYAHKLYSYHLGVGVGYDDISSSNLRFSDIDNCNYRQPFISQ